MPTEIVAQPLAGPVLQDWQHLNSFFDHPLILGIPIWVFISVIFLLALILVNLSWLFKIRKLAPVRGYRIAQKKATQEDVQTWVLGKTQKLTIECLRYIDSVLSYYNPAKITRWHHPARSSVIHIGGIPAMMVSDDYDQTRDIVSEIAICHACDEFNKDQKWWMGFRDELKKNNIELPDGMEEEGVAKPLNNFSDIRERGRLLLGYKYPEGIPIPAYSIFSPSKFSKYFPKGRSAGFLGGVFIQKARELKTDVKEPGLWEKYLPIGILFGLGVIAILAAWMAPVGK